MSVETYQSENENGLHRGNVGRMRMRLRDRIRSLFIRSTARKLHLFFYDLPPTFADDRCTFSGLIELKTTSRPVDSFASIDSSNCHNFHVFVLPSEIEELSVCISFLKRRTFEKRMVQEFD